MTAVSVLVFTLNEEKNLGACLDSLEWCDDKFVIDSYSTDGTRDICGGRGVPFVQHMFEGFGTQRNWALRNLDLKHDWVLILDDELIVAPLPGDGARDVRRRSPSAQRRLRQAAGIRAFR